MKLPALALSKPVAASAHRSDQAGIGEQRAAGAPSAATWWSAATMSAGRPDGIHFGLGANESAEAHVSVPRRTRIRGRCGRCTRPAVVARGAAP